MKIVKAAACLIALSGATAAASLFAPASAKSVEQKAVAPRTPAAVWVSGGARLGISIREVEEEDMKAGRLTSRGGALVEEVSEGSPAEKGGIRKGDILVEFDGERVRSARQLTRLVMETADGSKVTTVAVRDGQRVTLTVEPRADGEFDFGGLRDLGDWGRNFAFALPKAVPAVPPPTPMPPPAVWKMDELLGTAGGRRLGIQVDSLSPQLAEYFGTKDGVLVTTVQGDSSAAKAGVKAGDVITTLNGSAVDDPADLRRRVQDLEAGAEFTIGVMRDKKPLTLKGKLEQTVRRRSYRSIV
jgi:predicted metalloprotease with PDZ domain